MRANKSELKKYFHAIDSSIDAPRSQKKKLIDDLKNNTYSYLEDNPDATIQEIKNVFGTPSEIAEYYLASNADEMFKKKKSPLLIIILSSITLILVLLVVYFLGFKDKDKQTDGNPNNASSVSVAEIRDSENSSDDMTISENTNENSSSSDELVDPYPITVTETSFYILPESHLKALTESDIEGLSKKELSTARNEIYARHGRKFIDSDIQNYFNSQDWYKGTIEPEDFDDDVELNKTEIRNINFLLKHQEN